MRRIAGRAESPGTALPRRWHLATSMGYTNGMKTAVSLPDAIFRAADQLAKRARKSRSQLYADALREYLVRHAPDEVTEAMNRVVAQLDRGERDPFRRAAAHRIFEQTEW